MRKLIFLFALSVLTTGFAPAAIVYDNDFGGVISGDNASVDGYPIYNSVSISDSFVLSGSTILTGISLLVDEFPDFPVSSLNWYILDNGNPTHPRSGESGVSTLASGTATATLRFVKNITVGNLFLDVDELSLSVSTPTLTAGTTYWVVSL